MEERDFDIFFFCYSWQYVTKEIMVERDGDQSQSRQKELEDGEIDEYDEYDEYDADSCEGTSFSSPSSPSSPSTQSSDDGDEDGCCSRTACVKCVYPRTPLKKDYCSLCFRDLQRCAVWECPNGHTHCGKCLTEYIETSHKCIVCGRAFASEELLLLYHMQNPLFVKNYKLWSHHGDDYLINRWTYQVLDISGLEYVGVYDIAIDAIRR
jgi:hypothetical protein